VTLSHETRERRWRTLAVLCLCLTVITIDGTIVSVALPTLGRELGASTSELQWFVDGYTLAITSLLLFAGALGDRFGRHRALTGGLVVFAVGSVLAALSSSPEELIAARVVMGAGAAAIMPSTLSILIQVFTDPVERARAIAIWAGMSGLGVAIGPTLGGWLLGHFAWGAIFLVNLPLVLVALVAGRRLIPRSRVANPPPVDVVGALLASAGLTALTWATIGAPEHGWLSATTVAIGGAGLACLAGFIWWQQRTPQPLMDLRLFANARFAAGAFAITLVFFVLFGALFAYTQILQVVLGHSALTAGLCAVPMAAALGVCAPLSASLAGRVGAKVPVAGGLLVIAAGLGLLAAATPTSGLAHYAFALTLMGGGMGFAIAPATEAIMSSVPMAKAGVGSAVNDTTRELGGVLGVAVLGSVLASTYAAELRPAVAWLDPARAAAAEASITGAVAVARDVGPTRGDALLHTAQNAFVVAATSGFRLAAVLAVLGAIVVARWLPAHEPTAVPVAAPVRVPA
jgi:MFS transporter, DHA2 family, multidrug resistance protein